MIKITIIIILILLLLITLYSYYCLSSRMINFERARLEYILQKESEVTSKEKNIKVVADCSNKNEQLSQALNNINKIIGNYRLNDSSTGKNDSNVVIHSEELNQSCNNHNNSNNLNNNINQIINQSLDTKILNEVHTEYINNYK
jgi:hypothetical protein